MSNAPGAGRRQWDQQSHEAKVEKFYAPGAANFSEIHGGYLNFGLWEREGMTYLEAAEQLIRTLGERAQLDANSTLLDVACGTGAQDLVLAKTFGPKQISGLDLTWGHVEIARDRAKKAGLSDRLSFHHGTAVMLPFPDASFSHVMSVEGCVHFDTREAFMREAFRVLQPGGRLVMADYDLRREPKGADKLLLSAMCEAWHVPLANRVPATTFAGTLERIGFVEPKVEQVAEKTIPQYVREQYTWRHFRQLSKVRGTLISAGSLVIDALVALAYKRGILGYILVQAEKPKG
ncbi:MAG: methyltransferase domain-containing protein [Myxococcota bacterium]|nr:methyltransferase domain-containing protein [Myxococcota bacterium]